MDVPPSVYLRRTIAVIVVLLVGGLFATASANVTLTANWQGAGLHSSPVELLSEPFTSFLGLAPINSSSDPQLSVEPIFEPSSAPTLPANDQPNLDVSAASVYTVNTTDDLNDGTCNAVHCSLREAITAANVSSNLDTIAFSLSGAGPHNIKPDWILPAINYPLIIDGTTEPDYAGSPVIELDGSAPSLVGFNTYGLTYNSNATGSTVKGLSIINWQTAMRVRGNGTFQGNYLGIDASGAPAANSYGIEFLGTNFLVGGPNPGDGNVISGNSSSGLYLASGSLATIQGNYIGTNPAGDAAIPNGTGIWIRGSDNNLIGGTGSGEGNVISGNSTGIAISVGTTSSNPALNNVIQGNLIGLDATGTQPLGNSWAGVTVSTNMATYDNTVIGGIAPGSANVIAYNSVGVYIGGTSKGNQIRQNLIYSNTQLGIDLYTGSVAPTLNDVGDGDTGPNERQNFPVITQAIGDASSATIDWSLNSTAATVFDLDFHANSTCHSSGYGEGEIYVGSVTTAATDGSGNVADTSVFTAAIPSGYFITATATDPAGNTSEFSACEMFDSDLPLGATLYGPSGTIDTDTPTYWWAEELTANKYFLSVDGPSGNVIGQWYNEADVCVDSVCSVHPAVTLTDGASYDWTIQTGNNVGDGPVSSSMNFTVDLTLPPPTTLVVNSTDDASGTCDLTYCTLREAIIQSNALAGVNTIAFNIYGAGLHTIYPQSVLPTITDPVIIDGTTEPDYAGTPVVVINGSQEGSLSNVDGLMITAGDSAVRGLVINNFADAGIVLQTGGNNVIEGNFLGTDALGTTAQPNKNYGIAILSSNNNLIGGTTAGARNLISGHTINSSDAGVFIQYATDNIVQGNYIGTDVTGTLRLPNGNGIIIRSATTINNTIGGSAAGEGNVISGNTYAGIKFEQHTEGNFIYGNLIGTDSTGTLPVWNKYGIHFAPGHENQVGGSNAGEGNVISGNDEDGIRISTFSADNVIQGNSIGTDLSGMSAVPNLNGIYFEWTGSIRSLIGGTAPGEGNLISGNSQTGIANYDPRNSTGNIIQGNCIGTDVTCAGPLGNGYNGISIQSPNTLIGGGLPGAANIIGSNGAGAAAGSIYSAGIYATGTGQTIRGNMIGTNAAGTVDLGNMGYGIYATSGLIDVLSNVIANNNLGGIRIGAASVEVRDNAIYLNDGLGIDLGGDGVTPNDPQDVDTGSNNLQNYPVLASASADVTATLIDGTINTVPSTTVMLRFYTSDACDPSGYGEGETYLGSATVYTDTNGGATFYVAVAPAVAGDFLTSTATVNNATSEFSACQAISPLSTTLSSAPTLITPDDSAPVNWQPVYSWNAVAGATEYYLSVDGPGGSVLAGWHYAYDVCDGDGVCSFQQPTPLDPDTAYDWQVQARNSGSTSPWSTLAPFMTGPEPGQATLLAPLGTITEFDPDFRWTETSDTTLYQLDITFPDAGTYTFSYGSGVCDAGECTVALPYFLPEGGAYEWQITTFNQYGDGPSSTLGAFTLDVYDVPGTATLISPNGTVNSSQPVFSWSQVTGALVYGVRVYDDLSQEIAFQAFYANTSCDGGICEAQFYSWLNEGNYTWTVQAENPYGQGPESSAMTFDIVLASPPAPILSAPIGTINTLTPTYIWQESADTNVYYFELEQGGSPIHNAWLDSDDICVAGTCTYSPSISMLSLTYDWTVISYNYFKSGGSSTESFTIDVLPEAATLVSPKGIFGTSIPIFVWDAVYNTTQFSLEVVGPSGLVVAETYNAVDICSADQCSVEHLAGLPSEEGDYDWRVQTENAAGVGPWSSAFTITVGPIQVNTTSDADDGICDATHCSLREAIVLGNTYQGLDTIVFDIPGTGPHTIQPISALPTISQPLVIDGTTEPDFTGTPIIELDGSLTTSINGLTIASANTIVHGLVINRFDDNGIKITADNVTIQGNYIGTDITGSADLGNGSSGIEIVSADNAIIGGSNPGEGNVISGQGLGSGILLAQSDNNTIQGNHIGTDVSGMVALYNSIGIKVISSSNNLIGGTEEGARNVISGNGNGVNILWVNGSFDTDGNVIQGNYIGTDITGMNALANASTGVNITQNTSTVHITNTQIGGDIAGASNLISGNGSYGISIDGQGVMGTLIQGNMIGTDVTGAVALGNTYDGISISQAQFTTIGGTNPGSRNLVSGNLRHGIRVLFHGSLYPPPYWYTHTVVQNNYVGTDVTGTVPLGNQENGIYLEGSVGETIGGIGPGEGNLIAFNVESGVGIYTDVSEFSLQHSILGNLIHSNGGLGIEIYEKSTGGTITRVAGVTPNDPGDTDLGVNNLQNFPVLTGASAYPAQTVIKGTLNSTASTMFRVELFSNATCDPSGYGEGEIYLGSVDVTTDGSGDATFSKTLSTVLTAGEFITATATDPAGNTSEFSACLVVLTAPEAVQDNPFGQEDNQQVINVLGNDTGVGLVVDAVTQPGNGSTTINGDNTINYMPDNDFYGSDSFTYDACDTYGTCDTGTVMVTVNNINDPPDTQNDQADARAGVGIDIDVLANDSDSDDSIDTTTVVVASNPSNGTATPNPDGTIEYTANANFSGIDTFTYTVDDATGDTSNTATVQITVAPGNDVLVSAWSAAFLPTVNTQNTDYATTDGAEPDITCATPSGSSVWYSFTPGLDGLATISTASSNFDTVLAVWDGTPADLTDTACNDDANADVQSEVQLFVSAGATYYVMVRGNGASDSGVLQLSVDVAACYKISTGVNLPGSGRVKIRTAPNCGNSTHYLTGTSVTIDAVPMLGYTFREWGGGLSGMTDVSLVVAMTQSLQAIALFDAPMEGKHLIPVDSLDVDVVGATVTVLVTYEQTGCYHISETTQSLNGTQINVEIFAEKPSGVNCVAPSGSQMAIYQLPLTGSFVSGSYVVIVNGISLLFDVE